MSEIEFKPGDIYWDTEIKALHLRIFTTKRVYYVYYTSKEGIQRRPKIGDASILTLTQARKMAKELLAKVALGEDPSRDRKVARIGRSVREVFESCAKEHWSKSKYGVSGWAKEARRLYEKEIDPIFGARSLTAITPEEIESWHSRYGDKSGTTGNRALSVFSKIFVFAQKKKLIPQGINPCALVTRHEENSRERFATKEEIAKIGAILSRDAEKYPEKIAFLYLLIFTGSRPKAILKARWDQLEIRELNGDAIGVLKFQGKKGKEKVIVPPQAMEVLSKLPVRSERIFNTSLQMIRELWNKIREEAGCPDLWARDWRRTFSTLGLSTGHSIDLIAKSLNHSPNTAQEIYAKAMENSQIETVLDIALKMNALLKASQLSNT